jgi:hypothetical protein
VTIKVFWVQTGSISAANDVSLGEIIKVVKQIARYVRGFLYAYFSIRSNIRWSDWEKKKLNENENSTVSEVKEVLPELPRRENISLRMAEARFELVLWKEEYMEYF